MAHPSVPRALPVRLAATTAKALHCLARCGRPARPDSGLRRLAAALLALCLGLGFALPGAALAASAFSARQSGLEPPGGPRSVETLPNQSAGRTAEGGMGYTDAYGNTVTPREAPQAPQPRRVRRGATQAGRAPAARPRSAGPEAGLEFSLTAVFARQAKGPRDKGSIRYAALSFLAA